MSLVQKGRGGMCRIVSFSFLWLCFAFSACSARPTGRLVQATEDLAAEHGTSGSSLVEIAKELVARGYNAKDFIAAIEKEISRRDSVSTEIVNGGGYRSLCYDTPILQLGLLLCLPSVDTYLQEIGELDYDILDEGYSALLLLDPAAYNELAFNMAQRFPNVSKEELDESVALISSFTVLETADPRQFQGYLSLLNAYVKTYQDDYPDVLFWRSTVEQIMGQSNSRPRTTEPVNSAD